MTRIKNLRVFILAATAGLAAQLPWSELGTLAIHLFAPIALALIVARLFAERSLRARTIILFIVVGGVALARICWDAIVLNGGDWSFDGERTLVAISVVIQLFFAAITFVGACSALQRRHHAARQ